MRIPRHHQKICLNTDALQQAGQQLASPAPQIPHDEAAEQVKVPRHPQVVFPSLPFWLAAQNRHAEARAPCQLSQSLGHPCPTACAQGEIQVILRKLLQTRGILWHLSSVPALFSILGHVPNTCCLHLESIGCAVSQCHCHVSTSSPPTQCMTNFI